MVFPKTILLKEVYAIPSSLKYPFSSNILANQDQKSYSFCSYSYPLSSPQIEVNLYIRFSYARRFFHFFYYLSTIISRCFADVNLEVRECWFNSALLLQCREDSNCNWKKRDCVSFIGCDSQIALSSILLYNSNRSIIDNH